MAVRRATIRSCDRCRSEEDVERVRVQRGVDRKAFSFDACKDCYSKTALSEWESLRGGPRRVRRTVIDPTEVAKVASRRPRRKRA